MTSILLSVALAQTLPFDTRLTGEGVFEATLKEPIGPTFSVDVHDEVLEMAAGLAPAEAEVVRLYGIDAVTGAKVPVLDRIPRFEPVPDKETYSAFPVDNPGPATGILSGKAVYLSQCHGWIYSEVLGRFATQRGNIHETVEDMHNPEAMNQYLTAYLENAGASVYTVKERDLQTQMAIADNDGSGYTETGAGFATFGDGYAHASSYNYGVDPFNSGTTRRFPADGGAVATWQPSVPQDGYYAVYVSWDSDSDNATDAHYRITHPGGIIDRSFNQTVHGSTWQYVENLWLTAGSSLTVELIGDSSQPGRFLSADAVRIGGGMGIINRQGGTTGRPRWEGGGIQGAQYNGAPTSVYDPGGDGDGSDPSSRSRWADWEHPSNEPAIYVSWHSNALTGEPTSPARGTTVYYSGGGSDSPHSAECSSSAVTGSFTLSDELQDGIMEQITANWDAGWQDRGVNRACFAEVNPNYQNEMPSALIELAFHDNADDAYHLKHPAFRRDTSRGMLKGIIRYFAAQDGISPVFPPEPPLSVTAVHEPGGGIRLSWQPGPSGGVDGDAATGYRVYTSRDGRSWDTGSAVSGTTTVVNPPYETRFFRVVATNTGGQSFPSEVVGARHSPDGFAPVLVVGAFDRFDDGQLGFETITNVGGIKRMNVRALNASDIIAPLGRAVGSAGWFFDSATDEALPNIDLSAYDVVIWAAGEESEANETFSSTQQSQIQTFVNGGGALIASGSEVLWDLDQRGTAGDQSFAETVLGARFQADNANASTVDGTGVLSGLSMSFANGDYPVEFPDEIDPVGTPIANYASGGVAGVMSGSVAFFAFPLDAVGDDSQRTAVLSALLDELAPEVEPPEIEDPEPPPIEDTDPEPPTPPTEDTDDPLPPGPENPGADLNTRRVAISDLGGCGCTASGRAWAFGAWIPVLFALARRRA